MSILDCDVIGEIDEFLSKELDREKSRAIKLRPIPASVQACAHVDYYEGDFIAVQPLLKSNR